MINPDPKAARAGELKSNDLAADPSYDAGSVTVGQLAAQQFIADHGDWFLATDDDTRTREQQLILLGAMIARTPFRPAWTRDQAADIIDHAAKLADIIDHTRAADLTALIASPDNTVWCDDCNLFLFGAYHERAAGWWRTAGGRYLCLGCASDRAD